MPFVLANVTARKRKADKTPKTYFPFCFETVSLRHIQNKITKAIKAGNEKYAHLLYTVKLGEKKALKKKTGIRKSPFIVSI